METDLPGDIDVLLVSGFACKPCEHVKLRLEALKEEFPRLRVREVDIGTRDGTELAVRHRLAALPGVLVNGRMVLVGDVSESLLRERLWLASGGPALRA